MKKVLINLGFDLRTRFPIQADIFRTGHICIVGGTGSGKSMAALYILYGILSLPYKIQLYIGDFKKSGDYKGITPNFEEFEQVVGLIEKFYGIFEETEENSPAIKICLIDEYAGFITWLTQKDKKKCEEIKGKISNLLMLGRSRHCYVASIQQRISAQLFPSGIGAIDNYQILIGLGRLSVDSRKSLFAGEHLDKDFEESYSPVCGQGLILIDGQPLRAVQIPYISDKGRMTALLRKKANQ